MGTTARDDSDSRNIQQDINRTRSSMDETLDALGQRLKPSHLFDSVTEWFAGSSAPTGQHGERDETIRRATRNMTQTAWEKIRANPIAATGIGAAVAWLLLKSDEPQSSRSGSYDYSGSQRERIMRNSAQPQMYGGSYVDARTGEPYDVDAYRREGRQMGGSQSGSQSDSPGIGSRLTEMAGDVAHRAAESARSAAGYLSDKASDVASATGDRFSSVGHRASGVASSGYERAFDSSRHGTASAYSTGKHQMDTAISDHPLATGLAALAAGLLAGLAIPATRRENQLIGEQSHRFKEAAGDMASDVWQRGKDVGSDVLHEASDEAKRQGLTADTLGDKVSHVAKQAKQAISNVASTTAETAREDINDQVSELIPSDDDVDSADNDSVTVRGATTSGDKPDGASQLGDGPRTPQPY